MRKRRLGAVLALILALSMSFSSFAEEPDFGNGGTTTEQAAVTGQEMGTSQETVTETTSQETVTGTTEEYTEGSSGEESEEETGGDESTGEETSDSETGAGENSDTNSGTDSNTDADMNTDADSNTDTTDIDTDTESDSDSNTDTDTDSESGSDTDTDTDTEAETTDEGTESESEESEDGDEDTAEEAEEESAEDESADESDAAAAHNYEEDWDWDLDSDPVSAELTLTCTDEDCDEDSDGHTVTLGADDGMTITSETTEATEEEEGTITYTASVTYEEITYTDEQVVVLTDEEETEEADGCEAGEYETTTDGGITVSLEWDAGAFEADPDVEVEDLSESEALAYAEEALADEDVTVTAAYGVDITFYVEDEEVEPESAVRVTLELTSETAYDADGLYVIHKHEGRDAVVLEESADNVEEVEISVRRLTDQVTATFELEEFSGVVLTLTTEEEAVASIGETTYTSLDDAVSAASSGDTIVVLQNCTLEKGINLSASKTLTIVGQADEEGNEPEITFENYGMALWSGSSLTFQDLSVNITDIGTTPYTAEWNWGTVIAVSTTLTLNNVDMLMDGENATNYKGDSTSVHAIFLDNGCTFNVINDSNLTIQNYEEDALEWDGGSTSYSVNITNSTFLSRNNRSGFTGTFYANITNSDVRVLDSTGNGSNGTYYNINNSYVEFSGNRNWGMSAYKITMSNNSRVLAYNNGYSGVWTRILNVDSTCILHVERNGNHSTGATTNAGIVFYGNSSATSTIEEGADVLIKDNAGSGILTKQTVCNLTIYSATIVGNGTGSVDTYNGYGATYGGGVYNMGTMYLDSDVVIYNNHASVAGDDIYSVGDASSSASRVEQITFGDIDASWSLDDCAAYENSSSYCGVGELSRDDINYYGESIDGWYYDGYYDGSTTYTRITAVASGSSDSSDSETESSDTGSSDDESSDSTALTTLDYVTSAFSAAASAVTGSVTGIFTALSVDASETDTTSSDPVIEEDTEASTRYSVHETGENFIREYDFDSADSDGDGHVTETGTLALKAAHGLTPDTLDVEKAIVLDDGSKVSVAGGEAGKTYTFELSTYVSDVLSYYLDAMDVDNYVVVFADTLDSNFTYKNDLKVYVDETQLPSNAAAVTVSGNDIKISIDLSIIRDVYDESCSGFTLSFRYSATLGENVKKGVYPNNVVLTYTDLETEGSVTEEAEVKVVVTDLEVMKIWDDSDDAEEVRPDSVTVELYADGSATGKTAELSAENDWEYTFTGLPAYSDVSGEDGTAAEIVYTVVENKVDNYETSYSSIIGSAEGGYIIAVTNTHKLEETTPPDDTVDTGSIAVIKIDADTGETLAGASFTVYNVNQDESLGTFTTDRNGYFSVGPLALNATYVITEVKAPDGYVLDRTPIVVTLTAEKSSDAAHPYTIRIKNTAKSEDKTVTGTTDTGTTDTGTTDTGTTDTGTTVTGTTDTGTTDIGTTDTGTTGTDTTDTGTEVIRDTETIAATGDDGSLFVWLLVLAVSGAGLAGLVVYSVIRSRRRRRF